MLTEEQIKNLKPGDPVVVRGEFKSVDADGDFWIKTSNCHRCYDPLCVSLPSEHGTSVPSPKHATPRLFKKGDKVRVVEWNGRICEKFFREGISCGENLTVVRDEDCFLNVTVRISQGIEKAILSPFLELVTPIEALDPYLMLENVPSNSIEVRDKRTNKVEATFYFGKDHAYTFEQAATRAEAERDRLNAEWRKEQNND